MKSPRCALPGAVIVLLTMPSQADRVFVYNTHTYVLVQTKKSWDASHVYALSLGGPLARIDDAAENAAILLAASGEGGTSTAIDGGGAIYFWIGGKEIIADGTYAWINAANSETVFWTGGKNGGPAGGLYHNWGRNVVDASGPEPDNFNGTQNRAAYALSPWPVAGPEKIGQRGEWNDLNGSDLLYSLVEVPAPASDPGAPSNVQGTVSGQRSLLLTWQDNATNETSYQIFFDDNAENVFFPLGGSPSPANTTSLSLSGSRPHTTYRFMVRVFIGGVFADSGIASVSTPDWISSRAYHPATFGQPFTYQITTTAVAASASFAATGLAPGLQLDTQTGQITGTPTQAGIFQAEVSAMLADSTVLTAPLTLRVVHPAGAPVGTASVPAIAFTPASAPATRNLRDFFTDADTEVAVRFQTTKGSYDVALHQTATPLAVANFLKYVDGTTAAGGNYVNSIIHRAAPDFVVQGGGFTPGTPNIKGIPTDPSPLNEPGISNLTGTVAMAKLADDPNSATSQWFVNLKDNSQNLDNTNGGFTVFGRVLGQGMTVVEAIEALPRGIYNGVIIDYPPPTGTRTSNFTDWPMDTAPPAPTTLDQTKLVLVQSATRVEPLTFSVSPTAGLELATVLLENGNLTLIPLGGVFGDASFAVTATDLDGQSASQSLAVSVRDDFASWATRRNLGTGNDALPNADPEGDGVVNVFEFVLDGAPLISDAATVLPVVAAHQSEGGSAATLTFVLRKYLTGVRLQAESSDSLAAGSWSPFWADTDGFNVPNVVSSQDLTDRILVTVSHPVGTAPRFLRLKIEMLP